MALIRHLSAMEILDSRGRPTVKTSCAVGSGPVVSASVPSGRSTGTAEALELRDGDRSRYSGLGCRTAVANVNGAIRTAVADRDIASQADLDRALIALDGSPNKSRLGANAILSVSLAFARAVAAERGVPLFQYFASLVPTPAPWRCPRLTVNLFSGGKHAGQQLAIQDVLVVPLAARTVDDALAAVYAVYDAAARLLERKYAQRLLRADEGGLSPPAASCAQMLDDAVQSIHDAGLNPGTDVALAIDVASTHFFKNGRYTIDGRELTSCQMIELLKDWAKTYPIVSFEDGLAEDDWAEWPHLRRAFQEAPMDVMGDDFLCTNPLRIRRAIETQSANALLLKVNQVGTLTEAAEALRLARSAGWKVTVSARSGETEDDWLADLAVGFAADAIKVGSITQSERLAKYNRLLEIEPGLSAPLPS